MSAAVSARAANTQLGHTLRGGDTHGVAALGDALAAGGLLVRLEHALEVLIALVRLCKVLPEGSGARAAHEARAVQEGAVQQCWRVSPGPDFILVVQVADMPAYLALTLKLFTQDANVRNVKAFFSLKRAKFTSTWPVPAA